VLPQHIPLLVGGSSIHDQRCP